jgi:hypothetical protein
MMKTTRRYWLACAFTLAAIPFVALSQAPQRTAANLRLTATTDNVSGAGEIIKINLSNWSTDADRDQLAAAWMLTPSAADGARGARGARGGAGRGARGRGAAAPATPVVTNDDPAAVDDDNPAFRFGRGARGRDDASAVPVTPQSSLAAVLKKSATVGILWTSETIGYSIKYAYRLAQPDGSERIILATDRRVGAWSDLWKPAGGVAPTDYQFSVIELRLNAKGEGEGRGTLTGKVAIDGAAKTIAVEGYNALPVILKGVKRL